MVLINFKATHDEREAFKRMAARSTNGNLSAWLRVAASRFKLPKNRYGF